MSARKKAQATWGGRFSAGPAELMLRFGESVSFDHRLWAQDIRGSKAHATMLAQAGILTKKERDAILRGLDAIAQEIAAGKFKWSRDLEDVHMNIESALTARIGSVGKKLHTGRSRNDQVATDIRLYVREQVDIIVDLVGKVQIALVDLAERDADTPLEVFPRRQRSALRVQLNKHRPPPADPHAVARRLLLRVDPGVLEHLCGQV